MQIRTFRAGTPRAAGEGLRIGTVRFLPRGVRKEDYARLDYFDVWFPLLAPSAELIRWYKSGDKRDSRWRTFAARYRREMLKNTDSRQAVLLLLELSRSVPIAIGCYCEDEMRCHRTLLETIFVEVQAGR